MITTAGTNPSLAVLEDILIPEGYTFELELIRGKSENWYCLHLTPEDEGFELKTTLYGVSGSQIQKGAENLIKMLYKAEVNAMLERGRVPVTVKRLHINRGW